MTTHGQTDLLALVLVIRGCVKRLVIQRLQQNDQEVSSMVKRSVLWSRGQFNGQEVSSMVNRSVQWSRGQFKTTESLQQSSIYIFNLLIYSRQTVFKVYLGHY